MDEKLHSQLSTQPPLTRAELSETGIDRPDFVYVIGDAYVDHPSFGPAIICRTLQSRGYSVAVISQPNWRKASSFAHFGRPRLAFLVSSGNMDSMVNHYTSAKKRRSSDAYTEGGAAGARPDRAVIVYSQRIREAYNDVPILIGGIEASLRRFAHYDYWDDKVRASILLDSGADILMYGMGERSVVELADALSSGISIHDVTYVAGTCYKANDLSRIYDSIEVESFEAVSTDKRAYASAFIAQYRQQNPFDGKTIVQRHGNRFLVANPPSAPLSRQELDDVYELPYTRLPHPSYTKSIPALSEVEFSLTSARGCYGNCAFCALAFHQGRIVQSRSVDSLCREAVLLTRQPDFKGYIHDIGGPTAEFMEPACEKQMEHGACTDRSCLGYSKCPNLRITHSEYIAALRAVSRIEGVKKVFVRSGVRYDYAMYDKDRTFIRELARHHVSGQLRVAPEHIDDAVLRLMGKPAGEMYDRFVDQFARESAKAGLEQYVVPYFMSSHPGSTLDSAVALALYLKKTGQRPEQVQDFYPTPGTLSTCMYYTGLDPFTMRPVYVARDPKEKRMQRALMQYFLPQFRDEARRALVKAGRADLIGYSADALIHPASSQKIHGKKSRKK